MNKVPSVDPQSGPTQSHLLQAHPESSPTTPSLAAQVYADQVAFLYRNSLVGFAVSLVAGALLAFSMHSQVATSVLMLWYAALVLVTGLRFTLSYLYHRIRPAAHQARRWEGFFLTGTALAGLTWGSTIVFLYPTEAVAYQVFLALVLAGIAAGAVAVFSARVVAYLSFAVPILIPASIHFLAQGDSLHRVLGVLTLLFLGSMLVTARKSERAFRTSLELRFDNKQLAAEITERRRVQDALRASQERFRDFAESAADWFWEMDANLKFTAISERFEDVAGVPRKQLLGRGDRKLFSRYLEKPEELEAHLDLLGARDTVSRLGGDEFSLLLEDCPLQNGVDLAESLVATLEEFRFRWEGRSFGVGASVGVVPIVSGAETVVELLSQADLACYAAKDSGRNRVQVFRMEDSDLARRQSELHRVSELRDALEQDQFRLYAQPIQALPGGKTSHFEVLLRLETQTGEIVAPGSFIPAAERYGLMRDLDRWVIRNTIAAAASGFPNVPGAALFINLSGNSLDDHRLVRYVQENLKRAGVSAARIGFEITETTAVSHLGHAENLIQQLKNQGHRFALDDFGSGLSSFTYLKRLPVDFLKIDASFVRDMTEDTTAKAMITAIKQIGHTLDIHTIAEGVEAEATLAALSDLGIDYAQGFAVGPPVPLDVDAMSSALLER